MMLEKVNAVYRKLFNKLPHWLCHGKPVTCGLSVTTKWWNRAQNTFNDRKTQLIHFLLSLSLSARRSIEPTIGCCNLFASRIRIIISPYSLFSGLQRLDGTSGRPNMNLARGNNFSTENLLRTCGKSFLLRCYVPISNGIKKNNRKVHNKPIKFMCRPMLQLKDEKQRLTDQTDWLTAVTRRTMFPEFVFSNRAYTLRKSVLFIVRIQVQ
jgi:hypothetical protein